MNVAELEDKIIQASQAYYEGSPIMSDRDFDGLLAYLEAINPNSKILSMTGFGYDPYKNIGEKESHIYGNVIGIPKKPRNINDIPSEFLSGNILKSAKLDGGSIICYFVNGKLIKALTRGRDGIGINKTDKAKIVLEKELNLPDGFDFTGAIRGEWCISYKNWNEMLSLNIVTNDKHPRNIAIGYLNRDDNVDELKYCDIVFYKVIGYDDTNSTFNNVYKQHVINNNNFDIKFLRKFIKEEYIVDYEISDSPLNQDDLQMLFDRFREKYPCDGIVLTTANKSIEPLDNKFVAKYSVNNNEVAYKFVDETAIATIENIRWKMSKGNKAIPVINVSPVQISGATVRNASAYNAKYIYDNDLDVGSKVELVRSGEVIPYILSVVSNSNGTGREKLDNMHCLYCKTKLTWDGVDLVCKNKDCSNRDEQNLKVWVNNLAKVDGMSETLIFKFFDELNIDCLETLYNHSYADLEFYGEASNTHKGKFNQVLNKLLNDEINFVDLLIGLNIKMLGVKNADKLACNDKFISLFQEFLEIDDASLFISQASPIITECVGQAMAGNICSPDGISKIRNAKFVENRINYEHIVKEELIPVVITGKLSVPRKEFEEFLNNNGYEVKGAISKDTQYLITDNPNGTSSKNKRASELGIEKITEQEMRNIIENKNN